MKLHSAISPTLLRTLVLNQSCKVSSQDLHTSQQIRNIADPAKEPKPGVAILNNNNNNEDVTISFRENFMTKVYHYMSVYEEFIGIKQVKEAHERVLQAEERFVNSQERRRNAHSELVAMQNQLREVRGELDRTPRGQEKYLELITKEINLMREERVVRQNFEEHEKRERENFNELSNALRFSHEKERAQNEKTKYWSLIGSLVGASVGIIGTSINSQLKIRQLKKVMTESSTESLVGVQEKLSALVNQFEEAAKAFPEEKVSRVSTDVESKLLTSLDTLSQRIEDFNQRLEKVEVDWIAGSPGDANLPPVSNNSEAVQLQESSIRKTVSIAAATVIICVPLLNKLLSLFF